MKKILNVFFVGALLSVSLIAAARVNPQESRRKSKQNTPAVRPSVNKLAETKRMYVDTVATYIKNKTKDLKIVDAEGRINGPDMVKFLKVLNEEVKQYPDSRDARRFESTVSRKAFANACPGDFAKTLKGNAWLSFVRPAEDGLSKTYEMYEFTSIFYNLDPSSPENGYVIVTYADKTRQKFDAKGVLVKK